MTEKTDRDLIREMAEALEIARWFVDMYALRNPKWCDGDVEQDPSGAHALQAKLPSALAAARERLAREDAQPAAVSAHVSVPRELFEAWRGLCFGTDWNRGTAAGYHRRKIEVGMRELCSIQGEPSSFAAQLAAVSVQAVERAWLVEWRFNGIQWLYLWPRAPGGFSFTGDPSKALRFARREDAEAALQWARDTDAARRPIGSLSRHGLALGEMLATEHEWRDASAAPPARPVALEAPAELRGLDTSTRVRFYEHEFYVLSNFSAFSIKWQERLFPTSEHAYHWEKFAPGTKEKHGLYVRDHILMAESAHAAFKIAEVNKPLRRPDWDEVKVGVMREILRAKAAQHEYVRRKLLQTGDRELVEDSWRDDFWGWGPNRNGKNMLGLLWMEVRAELRGIGSDGGAGV